MDNKDKTMELKLFDESNKIDLNSDVNVNECNNENGNEYINENRNGNENDLNIHFKSVPKKRKCLISFNDDTLLTINELRNKSKLNIKSNQNMNVREQSENILDEAIINSGELNFDYNENVNNDDDNNINNIIDDNNNINNIINDNINNIDENKHNKNIIEIIENNNKVIQDNINIEND